MTLDIPVQAEPKKVTLREFLDSIEKNGYKQAFGSLFEYETEYDGLGASKTYEETPIKAACALGQGMANMGLYYISGGVGETSIEVGYALNAIMRKNDVERKTLAVIVDEIRIEYGEYLDETFNAWDTLDHPHSWNTPRPR